jgi:hypothetical protein
VCVLVHDASSHIMVACIASRPSQPDKAKQEAVRTPTRALGCCWAGANRLFKALTPFMSTMQAHKRGKGIHFVVPSLRA